MKNVLIVEDHLFFAQALERVLGEALVGGAKAWRFFRAGTVAEALRHISSGKRFALAVVDLMLPDGDGTEVVRKIKEVSPETPVAVLSASEDLSGALAAGADEAIDKATGFPEVVGSLVSLAGRLGSPLGDLLRDPLGNPKPGGIADHNT